MTPAPSFGWSSIARLGLVQAALGSIVVLTTSLLNRVMVVELHLAASVPGALVGFHYALQSLRPRWGYASDRARRRTPWIIGGMALLAAGGILAAVATAQMAQSFSIGLLLAIIAFTAIGVGVGASGTAALTLLADRVAPERKPAAASVVWIMMIAGFIATSASASAYLEPFTLARLVRFSAAVGGTAFVVTCIATIGLERGAVTRIEAASPGFGTALVTVWSDPVARRFTAFVFLSMLAYSAQDLILEPFAGLVFGLTPAETSAITSMQNGGVLAGMLAVALLGRFVGAGTKPGMVRVTMIGCTASAAALALIALCGTNALAGLLRPAIVALGFGNGVFAVSAIGLMMTLAKDGDGAGVRMGVWGAAQAIAFGGGGFAGTLAVDGLRIGFGLTTGGYAVVFLCEGVLFVAAALLLIRRGPSALRTHDRMMVAAE